VRAVGGFALRIAAHYDASVLVRRGLAALIALGVISCEWRGHEDRPLIDAGARPPVPLPPPPPVLEEMAKVVASRGTVEIRGTNADWKPASIGQTVSEQDALRTADDGMVEVSVRDVRLKVHEASELQVDQLAENRIRAKLKGRMESQVPSGKGEVEVESQDLPAVAKSKGGHFFMMSTGRGVVTVASVEGSVSLTSLGKTTEVAEGKRSTVTKGKAPSTPTATFEQVLLRVSWPKLVDKEPVREISGTLRGNARLFIQGHHVEVDKKGNFKKKVNLRDGEQVVRATAIDVAGRTDSQSRTLNLNRKLKLDAKSKWLKSSQP
jgi:hypothetical protein